MRSGPPDKGGARAQVSGSALGIALSIAMVAGPTAAQVMEVHVDGSVVTYDGPTQYSSAGARPIARVISPYRHRPGTPRAAAAPPPETAQAIHAAAERHQVSERLVEAVAWRESRFNPSAVSPKGARGIMQLMPQTAQALGVDASDPTSNIEGGTEYLSRMLRRFGGDTVKALAAYNAGPEAVERYQGVPPYAETIAYVDSIMGRLNHPDEAVAQASASLKARMGAYTY